MYNNHTGGVDLIDNLVSYYAIHTQNRKWYWCIYKWFLNVQMMQAWHMYRKVGGILGLKDMEKIPLLDFIRSCVEMLVLNHGESQMVTKLTSLHTSQKMDKIKYDNIGHLIIKTEKKHLQGCRARWI